MKRRDFLKAGAAVIGGAAGVTLAAEAAPGAEAQVGGDGLPTIRLGALEVSRLILGSNPFWGYSHKSAQLDQEMRDFHTDARITQILDEAAECGVTAIASPPDERWRAIWVLTGSRATAWT